MTAQFPGGSSDGDQVGGCFHERLAHGIDPVIDGKL
jgi:hypothetical protein